MDATGVVTLVICGGILLAAVIRFIIHIVSNRKDK